MPRYKTAIIASGTTAPAPPPPCLSLPADRRSAVFRERRDADPPDLVDWCSWHQQHAEMVIAAAARRPKAILCQKPMAVDLGEADAMMTACERNGVKLIIAYQRPHHATWLAARGLIRQGAIGRWRRIERDAGGHRYT